MSVKKSDIGERLLGQSQPPGSPREIAAVHLRSAANRRPPGPVALARVRTRLFASVALSNRPRLRWKTVVAVVALSAGVGGVTGAAVFVVMPILRRAPRASIGARARPEPLAAARRSHATRARPVEPSAEAMQETTVPGPVEPSGPTLGPTQALAPPTAVNAGAHAPSLDLAVSGNPSDSASAGAAGSASSPGSARLISRPSDHASASRKFAMVESAISRSTRSLPSPGLSPRPVSPPSASGPSTSSAAFAPSPAPASSALPSSVPTTRSPVSASALVPPPFAAAVPTTPEIAREARLLGLALQRLRQDHDPRAALALLDEHAARFPHGTFGPEADVTRVDALLALDRRQSALAILEHLDFPATTRGRELFVVRAELRAGAKRCADAISDFTRTLDNSAADSLYERALHGRIACYLATGNEAQARADLRNYLIRFPSGRFVNGVRQALNAIDSHDP